jgi:hypothetical protein
MSADLLDIYYVIDVFEKIDAWMPDLTPDSGRGILVYPP